MLGPWDALAARPFAGLCPLPSPRRTFLLSVELCPLQMSLRPRRSPGVDPQGSDSGGAGGARTCAAPSCAAARGSMSSLLPLRGAEHGGMVPRACSRRCWHADSPSTWAGATSTQRQGSASPQPCVGQRCPCPRGVLLGARRAPAEPRWLPGHDLASAGDQVRSCVQV